MQVNATRVSERECSRYPLSRESFGVDLYHKDRPGRHLGTFWWCITDLDSDNERVGISAIAAVFYVFDVSSQLEICCTKDYFWFSVGYVSDYTVL